ncbi:MAG: DNA repair protein RecO [Phycisphaerales bacterium]|nr:DNA repair protein RecO [Phycisphaerales bacterium]
MPTIQDHAVCVRHWDWSETSQTVSLMTREHGMIRCIAKGSKREKAAFSGGLEIATMGHMVAIVKPNSDLAILTAWDLVEPMYLIRQSLERFHACMYAIDLIPRLINDHDPHPYIYDALIQTLHATASPELCTTPQGIHAQLAWYQWQLLDHTGARPELMCDVHSGKELDEDAQVYGFSPALGGLTLDPRHMNDDRSSIALSDTWRVRRSTVDLLRQLREGTDSSELAGVSQDQITRVGGLLASYIRYVIGSEVPSSRLIYPDI